MRRRLSHLQPDWVARNGDLASHGGSPSNRRCCCHIHRSASMNIIPLALPLFLALLVAAAGTAQGAEPPAVKRCAAQLQSEQARIERDFSRERPPESDRVAFERWARNMHAALNAAGRSAESCERQSQPAMTPERRSTLETCISRVSAKSDEVNRRYSGRTLSREEQAQLRAAQLDLHEQRIACDLASRK